MTDLPTTPKMLSNLPRQSRKRAKFIYLLLDRNMGIGRNYVDAAFLGKGQYYMLVNGDNAEPVETISLLFSKLGEADIVIPYFADLDSRRWHRRITSQNFTRLINFASGLKIKYYNGPCIHLRQRHAVEP